MHTTFTAALVAQRQEEQRRLVRARRRGAAAQAGIRTVRPMRSEATRSATSSGVQPSADALRSIPSTRSPIRSTAASVPASSHPARPAWICTTPPALATKSGT